MSDQPEPSRPAPSAFEAETLRQYEQRYRRMALADGVSGRAYDEAYPAGYRLREWWNDLFDAVQRGRLALPIRPVVLRDIERRLGDRAIFFLQRAGGVPDTYLTLAARARQRQDHDQWVAARRRGRGAAA